MDQFHIYDYADGPSINRSNWIHLDGIYANINEDKIQEPKRIGPALAEMQAGARTVKKSSFRAAAVCLGLLCLLLLIGLITLVCLYTKGKKEMILLHNSSNKLTDERDQLQASFTNRTDERDQLQASFTHLMDERDQLQTDYRKLAEERDRLRRILQFMIKERTRHREPLEWIHSRDSLYLISSLRKSWQESRDDCQKRGADLVIINSIEEQEFISSFRKRVWIGLTDRETEGMWKWVDGTLLNTSYWSPGEPNGVPDRDEDCAEVKNYYLTDSWNDEPCGLKRSWICERTSPPASKPTIQ